MRRIALFLVFLLIFSLCGCSQKEEITSYNLNLISPSFADVHSYYAPKASDSEKYILTSSRAYEKYLNEERKDVINSLTICDDNISDETAQEIIAKCSQFNIPVFFLMNDIPQEIIQSYDKAFCISADYTYIGELFAEKINTLWEDTIIDKDGNRIFTFSVITPATLTNIQQAFYDSLIANIELLGIPLQQNEEIHLSKGDVLSYCTDNKKTNEAFIILDSKYLNVFPENYVPHKSGIEILGMEFGVENHYSDYPYMYLCFIDYTQCFNAKNAVMINIDSKAYPFKDIEYSIIDKTIYIQPTI